MNIGNIYQSNIYSLKQALGVAAMRKSMNQDNQTASVLISDMQKVNSRIMESSVAPHKGGNIDVKV